MTLFTVLPEAFAWSSLALALLSVPPLLSSAPEVQLGIPRRIAASIVTLSAVLCLFMVFLMALYGITGLYPYAHVLLMVPFRGQYAWRYWLYFLALLYAQLLWFPRIRARAEATLAIGGICALLASAGRIALYIWGSR